MAANAKGSSHQNQNIPRVCLPSDDADPVVNRREHNHHNDTLSDSELYEIPVLSAEIESKLGRALVPAPLSVELPGNGANAQVAQQHPPVRETKKAERGRLLRTAKLISVTNIVFDPIKVSENPLKYKLKPREVPAPLATEEMARVNGDQSASVDLLKGWKMELRQRGRRDLRDKFYSHPSCTKLFRSVAEVTRFVEKSHNSAYTTQPVDGAEKLPADTTTHSEDQPLEELPADTTTHSVDQPLEELPADTTTHSVDQPLEELPADTTHPVDETLELPAPQNVSLPEAPSPSKRKQEADALPGGSRTKRRRSFYAVSREVEAFPVTDVLAEAAGSLLCMSATPRVENDMPREEVEAFFLRANTALLNLFGNKEKDASAVGEEKEDLSLTRIDSKTESSNLIEGMVEEMIDELFDDPQGIFPLIDQKNGEGEELTPAGKDMEDWLAIESDVPVPPSAEQEHQESSGDSKSLPDPVGSSTDNV